MSWQITGESSFNSTVLSKCGIFNININIPPTLHLCKIILKSCFLFFIYLFYTFIFFSHLSSFVFSWGGLSHSHSDGVKKAICTHLDPCSLDWLLACDNMSSKPSEHNNLIVHAACDTLSYRARQGRGIDSESVRGRYSRQIRRREANFTLLFPLFTVGGGGCLNCKAA